MPEGTERGLLATGAAALGSPLDDEQLDRLALFLARLREWAPRVNLLAPGDLPQLVSRHVLDSLAAAGPLRELGPALSIADIGSGAGFPGIPLAIALAPRRMVLVEPRQRRASFLRAVARELSGLHIEVIRGRAEELGDEHDGAHDAVVSRASLPIGELQRAARFLLREGGQLLAHRGPSQAPARDEVGLRALAPFRYRLPGTGADLRIDRWRAEPVAPPDCFT